MAHKSTNVEVDERINAVYDLLLKAHSRTQIIRYGSEAWGISSRQVEKYIQRARELLQKDADLERPQWLAAAIARLYEYERRAAESNNIGVAVKALENQAKLLRFEM